VDDDLETLFRESQPAERCFAAVLFTDLARPSVRMSSIDDGAWLELVDEYRCIVRHQAARYNGHRVQSADGAFIRFSGAYSAVRCAVAIREDLHDVGLGLRAGLHAGEDSVRDAEATAVIARVASRICCLADVGRVLASQVLATQVAGSGVVFEDVGTYRLDDALGEWQLLAVSE